MDKELEFHLTNLLILKLLVFLINSFFFLLHTAQTGENIILPLKACVTFGFLFPLCFLHLRQYIFLIYIINYIKKIFCFNYYCT